MSDSWHSYPKVFTLGHKAVEDLLRDPVIVEEKIDGSQFSFGVFGGCIRVRSKNKEMIIDMPDKMFTEACKVVMSLPLREGWTYRAEYLQQPQHNALKYNRCPAKHLILFDINTANEVYLSYQEKKREAERLGLEIVPVFCEGMLTELSLFENLLETESCLGGHKIEGVVVKNYHRFGKDGKVLMGKFVSEEYKEVQAKEWKHQNSSGGDIIQRLILKYKTEARWQKSVQHLQERGVLTQAPQDIGILLNEVGIDVETECKEEIQELLWKWAWPKVRRAITGGLPEWYKGKLLTKQFEIIPKEEK